MERLWHQTMRIFSWANLKGNFHSIISLKPACHHLFGLDLVTFFSYGHPAKNP